MKETLYPYDKKPYPCDKKPYPYDKKPSTLMPL